MEGIAMLAAGNLLNSLSRENNNAEYSNDDSDLGEVLKYCHEEIETTHKFRYSDGTEEYFSFDN